MPVLIREALDQDKDVFVEFALSLSRFNRSMHHEPCHYDDFNKVLDAIRKNAEKAFDERNEDTYILIAFAERKPVGYALGSIFTQEETADNGTGRMGLFDQLFLNDAARGLGIGKQLMDQVMDWFKKKDIHRVKLHAYSWNTKARSIYETYGFQEYAVSYEKFI